MPAALPECHRLVLAAIDSMESYLESLRTEESRLYHGEGVNAGMARALQAMNRCFDWTRLAETVPTVEDLREFGVLYTLLRPLLRHTIWPTEADFPEVVHGWPAVDVLLIQYTRLCSRIRQAPRKSPSSVEGWWSTKGYVVEPVQLFPSVAAILLAWGRALGKSPAAVAALLVAFAAAGVGRAPVEDDGRVPVDFFVSPGNLARPGFPWRHRKRPNVLRRHVRELWAYDPSEGSVATLLLPGGGRPVPPDTRTVAISAQAAGSSSLVFAVSAVLAARGRSD